ncbi:hypothetical protein ACTXT7_001979 [Hymenolepis weldensis]
MASTHSQQPDQSRPPDTSLNSDHQNPSQPLPNKIFSRIRNLAVNFGHSSGMIRGDSQDLNFSSSSAAIPGRDVKQPMKSPQIHERDEIISDLRRQLMNKDQEIAFLISELDKYQSVFNQKSEGLGRGRQRGAKPEIGSMEMEADGPRKRGIGISAEPRALKVDEMEHPTHYPKTSNYPLAFSSFS